jgi:hypothetical protein
MTDGPYRASDVREGVALPRHGLRLASSAVLGAVLLEGAVLSWLFERGLIATRPGLLLAVTLVAAWLVAFTRLAWRLAIGRTDRSGIVVAAAALPALTVESLAMLDLHGATVARVAEAPEVLAAAVLDPLAIARVGAYATTAVALAAAGASGAGFVLTVDRARAGAKRVGSNGMLSAYAFVLVGAVAAITFVLLRIRDTHRDGLGGALAAAAIVVTAVLALILGRRLRALASWHDPVEVRALQRAATCAVTAAAFLGAATERAVLAYDEHLALGALIGRAPFDVRLEKAHAIASAWHAHGLAIAIVLIAALIPLVSITALRMGKSARSRDGLIAIAALAITLAAAARVELRERAMLVPAPDVAAPAALALPSAPMLPPSRVSGGAVPIVLGDDGKLAPSEAPPATAPFLLLVGRRTSAARVLDVARAASRSEACLTLGSVSRYFATLKTAVSVSQ